MKGIVLEIRNRTAAVLREDGVIVKTWQKCAVGDTIELSAEKIRFPSVRSVAARIGRTAFLDPLILTSPWRGPLFFTINFATF